MSRLKTFGTANDDIPADEMFVAKIIQNAKGRGLGWCKLAMFIDSDGWSAGSMTKAVACCAHGAASLLVETDRECDLAGWMFTIGNDADRLDRDADVIGRAYRDAMGGNEVPK